MMNTKPSMLSFKARAKEGGQALVLIAMLIVILLGFLGLAIDGGGMFLLWRDAQNAVDSAAMQAAFAYCTSNKDFDSAIEAGLNAAKANGFDNNAVDNWVTVVAAPDSRRPSNATSMDTNSVMLVTIRAVKPAYFIQLVYGGPLEVTVDTIGACNPASESIYEGYSVFAMGSNGLCPSSVDDKQMDATGSRQHYFGPIFTNGGINLGGSTFTFYDGAGVDYVTTPNEVDDGTKAKTDTGAVVPTNPVSQINYFPPLYDINEFLPAAFAASGSDGQYWAESYAQGSSKANLVNGTGDIQIGGNGVTLEGLYVNPSGGLKIKTNTIIGTGVTLVAKGIISAGGLDGSVYAWQPYVAGVTMFSIFDPASPNCNVSGGGSTAISFSASEIMGFGVLYAPNSAISISGSDGAWCGAMIANAIDRGGSDTWIFGQTIPPVSRLITLGVPSAFHQFAGRTCDYINNDTPPNYFLGD